MKPMRKNGRGLCRACRGKTAKAGDILCRECWPFVTLLQKRRFMAAWRSRQAKMIDDAGLLVEQDRLVEAARRSRFQQRAG